MNVMLLAFKMAVGPSHGWPEPYVHWAEYDEAPPQGKGVKDPFHHGWHGIEFPVDLPKPLLELIDRHPLRPENHGCHIVLTPILG